MAPDASTGELILPRRLLGNAAHRERTRWLRDHGVDPADFAAVRAMLSVSEVHHGLPDSSALARARRRAEGGTAVTTIPTRADEQRHFTGAQRGGDDYPQAGTLA